jgi:NADPH:quinone reductase-like Zn-dependent oxidoreductase
MSKASTQIHAGASGVGLAAIELVTAVGSVTNPKP